MENILNKTMTIAEARNVVNGYKALFIIDNLNDG